MKIKNIGKSLLKRNLFLIIVYFWLIPLLCTKILIVQLNKYISSPIFIICNVVVYN